MNNGFIFLHRKLIDWEWYTDVNVKCLFLHLLLIANHKDAKYQGTLVKRGQVLTGRMQLSATSGLSERNVRTCLAKLEATKEISIIATSRFSIITICKYNDYQNPKQQSDQHSDQPSDQQLTSDRPAIDQRPTTNNKDNKKKNENNDNKTVVFPESLNTKLFLDAWNQWVSYRTEAKKRLTVSTMEKQLKMLSSLPVDRAIKTIENSILNGWQGLFPEKPVVVENCQQPVLFGIPQDESALKAQKRWNAEREAKLAEIRQNKLVGVQ